MIKRMLIVVSGILLASIIASARKGPTPAYMHFYSDGSSSILCGGRHVNHPLDYLVGQCLHRSVETPTE